MATRRSGRVRVGNIASSQMVFLEEMKLLGPEKLDKLDVYQDLIRSRKEHHQDICEYEEKLLSKHKKSEPDNKGFLLTLISMSKRFEPDKKQRRKDDNAPDNETGSYENAVGGSKSYSGHSTSDEDIGPSRKLLFSKLKQKGTPYVLEDVGNGEHFLVPYEVDFCSDEDCACRDEDGGSRDEEREKEPKRKLRSSTEQQRDGASKKSRNKVKSEKIEKVKGSTSVKVPEPDHRFFQNKVKSEKIEKVKGSTSVKVLESDHRFFLKHCKYVDGYHVFSYGTDTVVYEKSKGENINKNKETKDDHAYSDDVEIIDSVTFYNERSLSPSKMNNEKHGSSIMESEFRHKVIGILRRPFEQEEYDKLCIEAEQRKKELRHRDLRDGNEKSIPTSIDGKSYLDHHPDLGRKLLLYQDDKPKCLNLLRGFFFWLQNIQQDGSFLPWNDEECLAIMPQSC